MRDFISDIIAYQNAPPGTNEGLPYWIFWLLLCVILLLLAFIFLRDKDLRQRINNFFFRTKQKLIKMKLQHRLKRETTKKETTLLNLGKKAWEEKIPIPKGEETLAHLNELSQKIDVKKTELKECEEKIVALNTAMVETNKTFDQDISEQDKIKNKHKEELNTLKEEEKKLESQVVAKQKEIEDLTHQINDLNDSLKQKKEPEKTNGKTEEIDPKKINQKISELSEKKEKSDAAIKSYVKDRSKLETEEENIEAKIDEVSKKINKLVEEQKEQTRKHQKEIKEWDKTRNKLLDKISSLEEEQIPLFESLGEILDEERLDHKEIEVFYSQLDRLDSKIQDLEKQIDDLP
jgi:uncharacterized coiled-coil DUF342 family protein